MIKKNLKAHIVKKWKKSAARMTAGAVLFAVLFGLSADISYAEGPTAVLSDEQADMEHAMDIVTPATCYVEVDPYMGSGFIVDTTDFYVYVMTNRHVALKNKENPVIEFFDGWRVDAEFVRNDDVNDVAVLRVKKEYIRPETLEALKVVVFRPDGQGIVEGEEVGIVARNTDATIYTTSGIVTDLKYMAYFSGEGTVKGILADYDRKGGTSGSGVFDTQGYIVGIHKGAIPAEGAFFLPIEEAWEEYMEVRQSDKEMKVLINREVTP